MSRLAGPRGEFAARLRQRGVARAVKVALDRTLALAGLIVALPLLIVVGIAIRLTMGSPVIFAQVRPGLSARPFRILKLRTMRVANESNAKHLPDEARLTRLGRVLRAYSIDELPQLWCVLRGDLSLVGPRPLLTEYLGRYSPEQARRHEVQPGITGWAQVHGRNAITWEEKFALDVWYVDHWSLCLDLRILAMTAARVLRKSGVSNPGHATMPKFTGRGDSQ